MSDPALRPRRAGKYGRRAPKNAPALEARSFLKLDAVIPPHPSSADYLRIMSAWSMLGNDRAGNCVAVTWANFRRLLTHFAGSERYPSQAEVWQFYKTQNPDFDPNGSPQVNGPGSPADQGMDIQTALEYLHKYGGPDSVKPVAFARVDYTNQQELQAALAIFGGLWLGVNVIQANMQEFDASQPWDYVPGSPTDGGHSILAGGYTPNVKFITWAAETEFTESFREHLFEEAWAVIWPEHLSTAQFQAGVDVNALAQAYQELTGASFPVPAPSPQPSPNPTPPPAPVPAPPVDKAFADWNLRVKPVYDKWTKHPIKYWRQLKAEIDAWTALED